MQSRAKHYHLIPALQPTWNSVNVVVVDSAVSDALQQGYIVRKNLVLAALVLVPMAVFLAHCNGHASLVITYDAQSHEVISAALAYFTQDVMSWCILQWLVDGMTDWDCISCEHTAATCWFQYLQI